MIVNDDERYSTFISKWMSCPREKMSERILSLVHRLFLECYLRKDFTGMTFTLISFL
jgi:hypothetical protein